MLVRLETREWLLIGRGVAAMFVCIVAGSIIVEIQLNQLTYWFDSVQVFNLRRVAAGSYFAYLLGTEYHIKAAWQIGAITASNRWLVLNLFGVAVKFPTQVHIDAAVVFAFLDTLWQQGLACAFVVKRQAAEYLAASAPVLRSLLRQAAELIR